jgi:hypothetical protein
MKQHLLSTFKQGQGSAIPIGFKRLTKYRRDKINTLIENIEE